MEEQRPKTSAEMLEAEAERIAKLSDKELRRQYSRIGGGGTIGILLGKELAMRAAMPKHHWSLSPAFFIALLAMIFAGIAAWPVIRDWLGQPYVSEKVSVFVSKTEGTPAITPTPSNEASPPPAQASFSSASTPTPTATP